MFRARARRNTTPAASRSTHPSQPTAARARAQTKHTARGLQPGPKPRASRRSYPIMPPFWGAPGTPAGIPGAAPVPLLPPFRSSPRAPVGTPGAQLLRRGAGGLRRAPPTLRPPPGAPGPPHTGCRAALSRKCINAVRAGPARVAWPRRPPLGKRVCHRDSHQGNSHKTRCEAARRGRKHLLGLTGLRVVTDRRSGGSRGALRGRDMAPGGPLHGALCGGGALFPPEGPQTLYCHPTFW